MDSGDFPGWPSTAGELSEFLIHSLPYSWATSLTALQTVASQVSPLLFPLPLVWGWECWMTFSFQAASDVTCWGLGVNSVGKNPKSLTLLRSGSFSPQPGSPCSPAWAINPPYPKAREVEVPLCLSSCSLLSLAQAWDTARSSINTCWIQLKTILQAETSDLLSSLLGDVPAIPKRGVLWEMSTASAS